MTITYDRTGKDGEIDVAVVIGSFGAKESICLVRAQFGIFDTIGAVATGILSLFAAPNI